MPQVKRSPVFNDQAITPDGAPAAGYFVYTYAAGSSAELAAYTDSSGTVAQPNPIVLDANGFPTNTIWLQAGLNYKLVLKDPNFVVVRTEDNISGINDASSSVSQWQASGVTPSYVSVSSFSVPGDQTSEFHADRRLQFTTAAGVAYGRIISSAYAAMTTVQVEMDAGFALDSGLSAVNLSILRADRHALPTPDQASMQKMINGGAEVAQGPVASLTTSAQYGQVDMCTMWASGGVVSAGTLTQNTAATVGTSGKSARVAGATLTGSGVISWRYRMEAADAVKYKNKTASFQIAVMHDTGANVPYQIIIRKPTAADNFTEVTTIHTASAVNVASGTATRLSASSVNLGDCSNGLEIEVQATCGAVTTKNFDFTEWQLDEGAVCRQFANRPHVIERVACRRYYRTGGASGPVSAQADGGGNYRSNTTVSLDPEMRVAPTVVLHSLAGTINKVTSNAEAATYGGAQADSTGAAATTRVRADSFVAVGANSTNKYWDAFTYTASARL